jgi:RecA-family ATPase
MNIYRMREWLAREKAIEVAASGSNLPDRSAERTTTDDTASALNVPEAQRARTLARLGIYSPSALEAAVKREAKKPYLVESLFRTGSLNVLIGDSGLGKTPLAIQMGICIAAGVPLFGRRVQQGTVLYCDAESSPSDFCEKLQTISRFLGLSAAPDQFNVWSPNWDGGRLDAGRFETVGTTLLERVNAVEPTFVVVDALRTFWPQAESKNHEAADTFNSLRKMRHVTWLILHHRRKVNQQGTVSDLIDNPHGWFQEAAGDRSC